MEWQGLFVPNDRANKIMNKELYSLIQISIRGDSYSLHSQGLHWESTQKNLQHNQLVKNQQLYIIWSPYFLVSAVMCYNCVFRKMLN